MSLIKKKICLLGDVGVGKTSLIRRYVENIFDDSYLTTIGVNISQKTVQTRNHTEIRFMIWDVEGFTEAETISANYFIGAAGALIVTDLTRMASIEVLPAIIRSFRKTAPKARLILVGNKTDLINESHPGLALLKKAAKDLGLPSIITSAKSGKNVGMCFERLAEKLEKDR